MKTNNDNVRLHRGKCLRLLPGTTVMINQEGDESLLYFMLSFFVYRMEDAGGNTAAQMEPFSLKELLPNEEIEAASFSLLEEKMKELYGHADEQDDRLQMANHFHFQSLMFFIMERYIDRVGTENPKAAVERTIQYQQQHYRETLNVEQLAQMANMSRRWYSFLFKEMTGQSPKDYLTELRIRRAKEMLHVAGNRLYDIARQVGFQDEHYFSRRFKQTVGVSPRQYVMNRRLLGISVTYPELLYSLDVKPIAIPDCRDEYPSYLKGSFKNVLRLKDAGWPDFETIRSVRPDFILAPAWKYQKNYETLTRIAPTVLLPERDDWRDELRDMADVLGKRREAERVIQAYESKVAAARERLRTIVGDESVIYLRIVENEAIVYGTHTSRGKIIYQELGLKPSITLLNVKLGVALTRETLPILKADHIILHIDGQKRGAQKIFEQLSKSDQWRRLTAVKRKQVFLAEGMAWYNFSFSPIATCHAIDEMIHRLETGNRKPYHA